MYLFSKQINIINGIVFLKTCNVLIEIQKIKLLFK